MSLLHKWLNQPHLYPFYSQGPSTLEQVTKRYAYRVSQEDPTRCLIAELRGVPFGYLQHYLNSSFPEYASDIIQEEIGVSFDYYIGEPSFLGEQLGAAMLKAAVECISPHISYENRFFCVGHRPENTSAIRCSKSAGFRYRRNFIEDGLEHELYVRDERQS